MLLRPAYLSQKTLGQAVDCMTGIGKKRELLSHWQRVAKLVLLKRM
jgi:hypothetical protein